MTETPEPVPQYFRYNVCREWQNMVLGGNHGAHKPNCRMCRRLCMKLVHFETIEVLQ
jgi:hypothetical protein